jgi:hypothetical protein
MMAAEKSKSPSTPPKLDDFIAKVVPDPKNPEQLSLVSGFLGASPEPAHTRIYADASLGSYIDVKTADIAHTEPLAKEQSPLGGSYVWLKSQAQVNFGSAGQASKPGKFLEGPLAAAYGGQFGGGAQPAYFNRATGGACERSQLCDVSIGCPGSLACNYHYTHPCATFVPCVEGGYGGAQGAAAAPAAAHPQGLTLACGVSEICKSLYCQTRFCTEICVTRAAYCYVTQEIFCLITRACPVESVACTPGFQTAGCPEIAAAPAAQPEGRFHTFVGCHTIPWHICNPKPTYSPEQCAPTYLVGCYPHGGGGPRPEADLPYPTYFDPCFSYLYFQCHPRTFSGCVSQICHTPACQTVACHTVLTCRF